MTISRVELMYEQLVTEFKAIKTANGYRTDPAVYRFIRQMDKVGTVPEIGVEIRDSDLIVVDDNANCFDELVPVVISGAVRADMDSDGSGDAVKAAGEALAHDMKKVAAALMLKYCIQSTGAGVWTIVYDGSRPHMVLQRFLWLDVARPMAEVLIEFTANVRNQEPTFE